MTTPIAWITGAGGLIGGYLMRLASACAPDWEVRGLTRRELDLTEFKATERAFASERPSLVLHCAGLTRSPVCQTDPTLAFQLNVDVTAHLAHLAEGIPFFFFSTDLVFDGRKGNYTEADEPRPLSVYAETKLRAEEIVLANRRHTVVRTSLTGGVSPTRNRGFNEELRRAWESRRMTTLFTDEFRCPTPAPVLARAVWELAARKATGLFHVAGGERLSRWEIGRLLAGRWPGVTPHMRPGSLRDYQGAPRSPDTSLNCDKAQRWLSFRLPGLGEWLRANPDEPF